MARKFDLSNLVGKKQPTYPKTCPVNRVVILNDRSGSMSKLHSRVTSETIEKVALMEANDKTNRSETYVTIVDFSNSYTVSVRDAIASKSLYYKPTIQDQGTNLNLSTKKAVEYALSLPRMSEDESILVMIFTDGYNQPDWSGRDVSDSDVRAAIQNADATNRFSIAVIGPSDSVQWINKVGIPVGNFESWDLTESGFASAQATQKMGVNNFYASRSAGATKTASFYQAQPDDLTKAQVQKLNELSPSDYKVHINPSAQATRQELRPFLQSLGYDFKKGFAYYQLDKLEIIQDNKDILVCEKATGKFFGKGNSGADIRRFLGLPVGVTSKVKPAFSTKYELYVQSNSVNRKLAPDQKVLVLL